MTAAYDLSTMTAGRVAGINVTEMRAGNQTLWTKPSTGPVPPPVPGWSLWLDPNTLALGDLTTWPAADGVDTSHVYNMGGAVPKPVVTTDGARKVVHFKANEGKVWFTHGATGYNSTVVGAVRATYSYMDRSITTIYPDTAAGGGNWLMGHHSAVGQDGGYGGNFCGVNAGVQPGVWKRYLMTGTDAPNYNIALFSDLAQLGATVGASAQRPDRKLSLSGYSDAGVQETSTFDCGTVIVYPFTLTAPQIALTQNYMIANWS